VKVTVSVGGTFHAFRLAEQLEARDMLHRLVTTHRPLRGERIAAGRIAANPWPELAMRGPRALGFRWPAGEYVKAVMFDRWATQYVGGCDVWVGFSLFSLMAQRAAQSAGARTVLERGSTHVLTQSALVSEEYRRWKYPAPALDRRLVDRQLEEYEEAQYIAVPSRFVHESFVAHGISPERLLLIPYGADCGLFSPGAPAGRPFRIVAVGVSLRKGTPYLLEAASRLGIGTPHARIDMEVWLAGSVAPDVAGVLRDASVPVRRLGALSHPELANVYRTASVFVLPSIEEGMALSVLEAMASGLPVIVTPNTGVTDILEHGREGLVVPPRDAAALAQAILELYENEPKRREMGEAASQTARRWTWDSYGDRVASAYARLTATRAGVV
jgi:glycosyltransferase involved in cell wall biosynthesis